MTQLDRKLVRDLLQMWGQALAISLVIGCGVATFVMSLSTLASLRLTMETYYDRYRFAQVFASLKRAPDSLADRIAAIPGVAQVQTRVVVDVNLDIAGMSEPAVGRIVSISERQAPGLNQLHLRSGRYIEPGREGEVLINEVFAQAHGFQQGDGFDAVINGHYKRLTIVGIALSPEFIFQIGNAGDLPDNKRFGVMWMGEKELEAAYDMDGAFNNVSLSLLRGASEPEVIQRLDALIEPYGGIGSYGRADQTSHRYLSDEMKGLRGMGLIAPAIFLSVAAFLLYVVLNRVISTQREQIAALKAFGYYNWEVGWHYAKFVLVIVMLGSVMGAVTGARLGMGMTAMYTQFYRFPVFQFHFDGAVALLALGVSIGAAIIGSMGAIYHAASLPPAEAMRPEPPARFQPAIVERIGLQALFSQTARMVLRQLERRPFKACMAAYGISLAVSVLVVGNFIEDATDYLIDFQFERVQRQDVSIMFVEPATPSARYEVSHLPGVMRSETFRVVPVRVRYQNRSRRTGLMGLESRRELFRLVDVDRGAVSPPPEGILMSDKLAELLGVPVGEKVTVEVMQGERQVVQVPVNAVIKEYAGTSVYMDMEALHRLLEEGDTVSGAHLAVDPVSMDVLYHELKQMPKVSGVSIQEAALKSFEETIAQNQLQMKRINIVFACIIAFGVVYNTARISLSERSRELATLRVIGFTRGEVSAILFGELAALTLVAVPFGMVQGYALAALTTWAFETELFRIPLVISPYTYAFAAAVTLIASLASALVVRRRIDQLDLVSVLKSKE